MQASEARDGLRDHRDAIVTEIERAERGEIEERQWERGEIEGAQGDVGQAHERCKKGEREREGVAHRLCVPERHKVNKREGERDIEREKLF